MEIQTVQFQHNSWFHYNYNLSSEKFYIVSMRVRFIEVIRKSLFLYWNEGFTFLIDKLNLSVDCNEYQIMELNIWVVFNQLFLVNMELHQERWANFQEHGIFLDMDIWNMKYQQWKYQFTLKVFHYCLHICCIEKRMNMVMRRCSEFVNYRSTIWLPNFSKVV